MAAVGTILTRALPTSTKESLTYAFTHVQNTLNLLMSDIYQAALHVSWAPKVRQETCVVYPKL